MNLAERKRMHHLFKVGDVVTWGRGTVSHRIVEVREHGVVLDTTSVDFGELQSDGKRFHYVAFDNNNRDPNGRGPIRHSKDVPDKVNDGPGEGQRTEGA